MYIIYEYNMYICIYLTYVYFMRVETGQTTDLFFHEGSDLGVAQFLVQLLEAGQEGQSERPDRKIVNDNCAQFLDPSTFKFEVKTNFRSGIT